MNAIMLEGYIEPRTKSSGRVRQAHSERYSWSVGRRCIHVHRDHLEIFGRIRDRDADGARAAMRKHICWAEEHLDEPGA